MTEFNLINLKQDSSISGASEKLRNGKTGKEAEQMMPFACVMGNACHATTQKTGEISPDPRSDKGKIGGRSNKGNAIRRGGAFNIDPENNILSAGKGKTEKTNQLLNNILNAGKGKTEKTNQLLNNILGAEKDKTEKTNQLLNNILGAEKDKTEKTNQSLNNILGVGKDKTERTNKSLPVKGKETKTNGSFSGKIDLLSKKDSQKQIGEKIENLRGSSGLKKSKAGKDEVRGQRAEVRGQRLEVGDQRAKMEDAHELLKFSLKNADAVKGKTAVGQNSIAGKIAVAVSKEGGFRESWAGINNVLVRGQRVKVRDQRSELARRQSGGVRGQKANMENATGLLKSSLKNAVVVKGKSAVEPDKTEKNSFTLTKNDGGKNEIKDILRHSGLKSGETMEILHRKISSPLHSDKISSAGAYHHTSFHSGGSSAAVNDSVNSSGIEPRILINQIASAAKRSGRVRITLNPPRLGTLDMDVLVRNNKVHVILQVENNDVRQILQSNIESLKSSLRNHGLVADTINVSVQEKSDGSNYGADYRSGQNETLFKEGGNREGNEEDHEGERDLLNNDPSLFDEENPRVQSDGHVSLFA